MSKIGITPNTVQEVEVPDSSIEEQINSLHDYLDELNTALVALQQNLSEVMCTTTHQGVSGELTTPVMSLTAERIFAAKDRVRDDALFVHWINENLNIKDKSNV